MLRQATICFAAIAALTLLAACSESGEGGRQVRIKQADDGCTPTSVDAATGEELQFVVKNDTGDTWELEGTDGTNLEEVLIPEGRERSIGFTVPDEPGTYKLKCYTPGGQSTIIEVLATGESAPGGSEDEETPAGANTGAEGSADETVAVELDEYEVKPDVSSAGTGRVRFTAQNLSESLVHELAVLRVEDDGSLKVEGEIEDIDPGKGGAITLELDAGAYQLACLIVPGEAGSTVDHYKEGMYATFSVE